MQIANALGQSPLFAKYTVKLAASAAAGAEFLRVSISEALLPQRNRNTDAVSTLLKADIYAAKAEGVDAVFIDPITNLTNGMSAADANTKLQEIAQELAAMAKDLDIAVFIFCHLRNPDAGLPHDRGGAVLTSQFAGSRAMGRSCNYMFGIEGNKDPDLPEEERNIRTIVLLDDREYGEVGRFPLYWSNKTTMFTEIKK